MVRSIDKGKKYIVAIHHKNETITFKNVIGESEFTNFQIPEMQIETSKGEYYSLFDTYENMHDAVIDSLKEINQNINFLSSSIKENEIKIEQDKKKLEQKKKYLTEFIQKYANNF